ncbi:cation-translocating P-type ATPase [Mycoplasma sp. 4013]
MNQDIIYSGLTSQQAKQKQQENGFNKITSEKKLNIFKVFISQFKDFMIILLLIAAAFSFAVAIYETVSKNSKSQTDIIVGFIEPLIILIVIVLNSILGTYQEIKSDQAVKALEKNNQLISKVYRDGQLMHLPAEELVVGDIIVLDAGDYAGADAKILQAYCVNVVEAALTGESLPVEKNALEDNQHQNIIENTNRVFAGTYLTNGHCVAEVVAIGKDTQIGNINKLIQEQKPQFTPLQIKLNKLSKLFGISGVVLLVITTVIQFIISNVFTNIWNNPEVYSNAVIIGISLAVAAIPEGLITFTTVLLAIGVATMTKKHVIIKAFPAVETLGATSVICSDKTGTLTENKMTVMHLYDAIDPDVPYEKSSALGAFVACCDASVQIGENGEYIEVGDPTETGILRFGLDNQNSAQMFYQTFQKLDSLPFDSDRKTMSVLVKNPKGEKILITKGAPDVIFAKSKDASEYQYQLNESWAQKSYRVIAVGYKKMDASAEKITFDDENNLVFLGLIAMQDPPRAGVKESIEIAKQAGIHPVMITGDHLTTATAIATDLGIYKYGDKAITGAQLATMTDDELYKNVRNISVYARVSPTDKLRIVKAWQGYHEVVAMTGDGVNDAPALKASDVGVAMGITGTDVSKQAADVILTDDNFTTIVKGIKSGRETYNRIKTVILNLLVSSLSEIIVMIIGLFVLSIIFKKHIIADAEVIVLSASQLLWINLLTHGLPAIALGMTPSNLDVMQQKPINKNQSIFANGLWKQLLIQSVIISIGALLAYLTVALVAISNNIKGDDFIKLTSTATFIALGVGASINSINLMSVKSIFRCNIKEYKLVYAASLFSLICVIFVAFVPGIRVAFKMADISKITNYNVAYSLAPILFGLLLTIYFEASKLIKWYKKPKTA